MDLPRELERKQLPRTFWTTPCSLAVASMLPNHGTCFSLTSAETTHKSRKFSQNLDLFSNLLRTETRRAYKTEAITFIDNNLLKTEGCWWLGDPWD